MTVRTDQRTGTPSPLRVTGASKTFGANRVLSGVDLEIASKEIRALVGENGSGKSTLVKILAGYHVPDAGTAISVAGTPLEGHDPLASDEAGLRFVHQDLALVDALSTVENLGLGRGYGNRRGRPVHWSRRRREARSALAELGYEFEVDRPIAQLRASERTAVAIARAISPHRSPARLLTLDEPTANLPGPEVDRLFSLIRRVRDSGIAILFISHHLTEVFELADSVTVLRGGSLVATRPVAEVDEEELVSLMVGHPVESSSGRPAGEGREVLLAARGLSGRSLRGVDLEVAAGEIVGVAGITGSGREEVAPLIFGALAGSGTVELEGRPMKPGRPDRSIEAGMALVPSERPLNAVFPGHDLGENVSIARPRDFVRRGVFRRRLETAAVGEWIERLDVRPARARMPIGQLSGGNAQKVILARWLRLKPKVLLLDEPTQGVDVGAREDIHRLIEAAAEEGCAVLLCSTDSEELARVCTRIVVLLRGEACAEMTAPVEPDGITAASLTGAKGGEE